MSSSGYSISKTSFLKFEQCSKAFFLYKKHPYLRDKISVDRQLTFKRGHDVGFFAQQLFPGGTDVSKDLKGSFQGVERTEALIREKAEVIYEATFLFNGVLIMADILHYNEGRYTAYEVKSSMKISENYLKDAYLQYYILKHALPGFDDLFLVTLNPDYIRAGEIEPKKLFRKRSVKQKAEQNIPYFEHQINQALQVLEQDSIPNVPIGRQCFRPYQCDYFGTCWKDTLHEKSIFNLPYIEKSRLMEWFEQGIRNIEQVGDELIGRPAALKIKQAFTSNTSIIDPQKIKEFLLRIREPMATMDMEIWSPAIPQLSGTKPFEQIPFLVSFYNGTETSHVFAAHELSDERRSFAEHFLNLSESYATIVVYDKNMELNIINSLIARFPEFAAGLEEVKTKLVDIFEIFLELAYYNPAFKSNFSLKTVASVLLEDVQYTRITSGLEAMNYFEHYRLAPPLEKEEIRNDLVAYCDTDTVATYKLVNFLRTLSA